MTSIWGSRINQTPPCLESASSTVLARVTSTDKIHWLHRQNTLAIQVAVPTSWQINPKDMNVKWFPGTNKEEINARPSRKSVWSSRMWEMGGCCLRQRERELGEQSTEGQKPFQEPDVLFKAVCVCLAPALPGDDHDLPFARIAAPGL